MPVTKSHKNEDIAEPTGETATFEAAFARLEKILEKMNTGTISLDESLKLYEEADGLISRCSKKLNDAEKKIEELIKSRGGELALGPDQKPLTKDFSLSTQGGNPPRNP